MSDRKKRSIVLERMRIYGYFSQMVAIFPLLPIGEKISLRKWEKKYVGGNEHIGTSDWPGWEKHIGKRPEFPPIREPKKEPIPNNVRWEVWERDNFTCRHCGTRLYLSVDHIIPESQGGKLKINNLQTLCRKCNSKKGKKLG